MSLQIINLTRSNSITNLPQVMRFVHKNCHLLELGIACVPKLPDVVAEIGSFHGLQLLSIGGPSSCLDYDSFNVILDRIFPALQSLRILVLHGMEEWDTLPQQLQRLTTLHTLSLCTFGVEVVREYVIYENFGIMGFPELMEPALQEIHARPHYINNKKMFHIKAESQTRICKR